MTSKEIESNVRQIFENLTKKEFIFDLLIAYGISKTSITRIKNGDFNLSKIEGEVLYKKKIFFKEAESDKLLSTIEILSKEERILKHNPRFIIVTDYKTLAAKDLKTKKNLDIAFEELPKYFDFFLPLAGSEVYITKNNNKADREAAYKMAELYDKLIEGNQDTYTSKENVHELNIFLSRLLFCFFAEDTEIFEEEEGMFTNTLVQHTLENGSDTHLFLNDLFSRLNSKDGSLLPSYLAKFPYVNGGLFKDSINTPLFTTKARRILIDLGELNWQEINPDIFGSMIQAVVLPDYRSDLGMHYTSVENILKLIRPLFLDELYEEYEKCTTEIQLRRLIFRISKTHFFDPACGSGNFLIITYKEIRLLEILILQKIIELDSNPRIEYTQIALSQFYGIEIDDFAHEMAILSLWLAEHQMNLIFEERLYGYGKSKPILPLKDAGQITRGNATRIDWKEVCPVSKEDEVYIIGNPPYLGYSKQDGEQKKDMAIAFNAIKNYKKLDYIACWFYKATQYIENTNCKYAFVSTNSLTQGEQVALLWPLILNKKQEIFFAHQSFKWTNNAKGNAGVSVIIIGIRNLNNKQKILFYDNYRRITSNINPYLTSGENTIIAKRSKPLSQLPEMQKGSQPSDGGYLLLSTTEKNEFLFNFPEFDKNLKPFVGAKEYINKEDRFCLWFEEENINDLNTIDFLKKRFDSVANIRINSTKTATQKISAVPHKFGEIRYYSKEAIIVPTITSEKREYIPCGFVDGNTIISNTAQSVYNFTPYIFGVISSRLMLVWVKSLGGKFKTDYIFSSTLCYNTFPFPDISIKQKENLNLYVFAILDERGKHPEKTMAQLYNPETMPVGLRKAHKELDEAIEKCYRLQPFTTDTERLEYLFKLYEEMIQKDTLFAKQKSKRNQKIKK